MARNWYTEGDALGGRLIDAIAQHGLGGEPHDAELIELTKAYAAAISRGESSEDIAEELGIRLASAALREVRSQAANGGLSREDRFALELAIARAESWFAEYTAADSGRHYWELEARRAGHWVVLALPEAIDTTDLDGLELYNVSDEVEGYPAYRLPDRFAVIRYARAALAVGQEQLAAHPDDSELADAVKACANFLLAYDANN
jgi:hypothetical protein